MNPVNTPPTPGGVPPTEKSSAGVYIGIGLAVALVVAVIYAVSASYVTSLGAAPSPSSAAPTPTQTRTPGKTSSSMYLDSSSSDTDTYDPSHSDTQPEGIALVDQANKVLDSGKFVDDARIMQMVNRIIYRTYGTDQNPQAAQREDFPTDVLRPGSELIIGTVGSEQSSACTVGWIGVGTGTVYIITAGHCIDRADDPNIISYVGPGMRPVRIPATLLAADSFGTTSPLTASSGAMADYAIYKITDMDFTRKRVSPSPMSNGKVLTPMKGKELRDVAAGDEVCSMGYRSGEVCGRVLYTNFNHLVFHGNTIPGDSGGPVYIKHGDGSVTILGIVHGSLNTHSAGINDMGVQAIPQAVIAVRIAHPYTVAREHDSSFGILFDSLRG